MRIAAMGDIHSNHIALEACMRWVYQNDIDGIAFLGDYVSDCPYPQKTMQILRNIPPAYKTWFVRGNREDYMLEHRRNLTEGWEYNSQSGSLLYTFENLTGGDLRFFEDMPAAFDMPRLDAERARAFLRRHAKNARGDGRNDYRAAHLRALPPAV